MESLDLDINNYTIKDLEKFFQIEPNSKYSASDIELKEKQLRELLLTSGNIDKKFKRDLIVFLETAKNWLILVKCGNEKTNPTIFQNTPKMEKYPNVPMLKDIGSRFEEMPMRSETSYVNTFNSEYFPGIINPLKTRLITKCLNIDTRFRDHETQTSSSDFLLNLPMKLQKVVSMQITAIELPVSFYGISSKYGNNFFTISATQQMTPDGPITEESKVIIFPDGNYNSGDFISVLNELVSSTNADGSHINVNSMFNYIIFRLDVTNSGSGTGKVFLETTGNLASTIKSIGMDFTKDINGKYDKTPITTKMGNNMGFLKRKYQGATMYESETLIEPASVRYIYLAIDDFNNAMNNHFISAFPASNINSNVLARISIKGSYFTLLMESDLNITTEPRKYYGPVDIQKMRIQIFDDHGRVLDMNNSNFSCCLMFKCLYDL
jgi:hypothetical protein